LNDISLPPEALPRPWWMTGLAVFCLTTVAFLASRDLFLTETRDVEVWLGFEVHGVAALLTAPLHWAIFAVGAWGFWNQRPWVLPWSSGYLFYVALSHIIWNEVSPNGGGWSSGLAQALAISLPAILLLRAHRITTACSGH
jgi:hypothetical protein